jgi:hypothetical protein
MRSAGASHNERPARAVMFAVTVACLSYLRPIDGGGAVDFFKTGSSSDRRGAGARSLFLQLP